MTMKRIKFLTISILSVMLIAFTGCKKEEIEIIPEILPEPESVTISAAIDIDNTKVNYDVQYAITKVYWNANEDISMVYSSAPANEYVLFFMAGAGSVEVVLNSAF